MDALEWTKVLQVVAVAAGQGARSVTRGRQIVADATVNTVQRWESVVLRGRAIADLEPWARHVGANEAKRLLARSRACSHRTVAGQAPEATVDSEVVEPGENCAPDSGSVRLPRLVERCELERWKKILRGRQFEVVARMLQPGMTLGRAAQELGMDRANVRRSLRSALARMNRCESDSPPLYLVQGRVRPCMERRTAKPKDSQMELRPFYLFLPLAILTAVPIAAQGQVQHTGSGGQNFTITRVFWRNNPAPLSDDSPGTFNFELAKAKAGPGSAEGAANAYDQLTGYDASAEANDWHRSEWHISASNPTIGFTMSVGGAMTAGGWTNIVNPSCSAFAACAHSAKVSLVNGKREAGVYLSGATTSASGLVSWGDVSIQVELPGVSAGWKVSPVFQVHQTGEHPITENGAPSPMPGKGLDQLDAWGVTTSCTLTIESGVWVKAYADGWWVILGWDMAQAKAYAITAFVFSVGGTDVVMQALVDLEPRPNDSGDTNGGHGGH